jgi:predicted secreted protein
MKAIRLDESANQSLRVSTNEDVALEISGAGATGYVWEVVTKSPELEVLDHKVQPDLASIGASGVDRFVVRAKHAGVQRLVLALRRPWEERALKQFEISLDVEGAD